MQVVQRLAVWLATFSAAVLATGASAYTETSRGFNLPTGATEIAGEVYGLHMMMFWVCTVIGVIVFGAMIYSIFRHRKSLGVKPASFHHSTTVEVIWTVIPFFILVAVAIPAAGTLIKMEDTRGADMTIKVTGYQWLWEYEYLGEGVRFFSRLSEESNRARQLRSGIDVRTVENYLVDVDRPLVIPAGKKVRFLITANDVIHAWWVPEFAVKKDAIPGYINETWARVDRPGVYRGVCAELCGRDHGFMPIVVEVLPPDEFEAWLAAQKNGGAVADLAPAAPAPVATAPAVEVAAAPAAASDAAPAAAGMDKAALMEQGQKVYAANCQACHQASGAGLPPNFPSLIGSPKITGPATAQIEQTLQGKGLMPPFRHLSDADIAAVITFTRNSWGNDTGVVLPGDVAALR